MDNKKKVNIILEKEGKEGEEQRRVLNYKTYQHQQIVHLFGADKVCNYIYNVRNEQQ